jgi:pimeloyl-ACP methyl ester carboxylesterase
MGSADRDMAVSAIYEILKWKQEQESSSLAEYSDRLRNINGAPTGEETALDESVTLIPGVGHFVAQVKPDEFNQTLEQILAEYQTDKNGQE